MQSARLVAADTLLADLLSRDPQNFEALRQKGIFAADAHDWHTPITAQEMLLAQAPDSPALEFLPPG